MLEHNAAVVATVPDSRCKATHHDDRRRGGNIHETDAQLLLLMQIDFVGAGVDENAAGRPKRPFLAMRAAS